MAKVLDNTMEKLKKCSASLEKAIAKLNSTKFTPYSNTIVGTSSKKVVDIIDITKEVVVLEMNRADELYNKINGKDTKKVKISNLKSSAKSALKAGNKTKAMKKLNKLIEQGKQSWVDSILEKLGYTAKYSKGVISVLKLKKDNSSKSSTKSAKTATTSNVVATNAVVTKKTASKVTTVASLKKALKKALKKNDGSALAAYTLLASAIGKKKAKAYVNKLGYNVTYKNNKVVSLVKLEEKKLVTVEKNSNKEQNISNNTETNKNDNRKPSAIIDKEDKLPDTNDNIENKNPNNDVVASVEEPNTTVEQPSNNSTTNNSNSNNPSINNTKKEPITGNNNSEVTNGEKSSNMQEGSIASEVPTDAELDVEETPKKDHKVTTIDTDDTEEETKKSKGLGAVVPLGLGAIATGAAAVAGVRYIKNRDEYAEEEEYEDDDSSYMDSAQYEEEDYDNYAGPAGSIYTDVSSSSVDELYLEENVDNTYIDPDDFDDYEDYDTDEEVIEELNSKFDKE